MKTLKTMLLLAIVVFAITPLQAQKLIKKELQTENKKEDGFQYQWNKYTYLSGKDTLEAAFDMNDNRITPNGYKPGKGNWGVHYIGGGMFYVGSKNKDAFGNWLMTGYNVKGECIFPETIHHFIYYLGDGLFMLESKNELGKMVNGLYDYKGNCIIPESKGFFCFSKKKNTNFIECDMEIGDDICNALYDLNGNCIISEELGYTWIHYYPEYEFFWCDKGDIEHTITKDGRYYAIGHYNANKRQEFERNKRQVPNWNKNRTSTVTSPSSSSTTSSNAESGLLYQGEYTVSEDVGSMIEMISIYEDRVCTGVTSFAYKSTNASGERVYAGDGAFGVFWRFYVSPNYNIRIIKEYPNPYTGIPTTENCRVTKGVSSTPVQNGGGYYDGGSNTSNPNSSSGNPVQPHQVTKDCPLCHGSGKCSTCNGTHRIDYQFGAGTLECPNCKPDGRCTHCGGTGKVTSTKYY